MNRLNRIFSEKNKFLSVILIVFCMSLIAVSILTRIPQEKSVYVDNDAPFHVLLTMQAYDETDVSVHKFVPLVSLGEQSDKSIPWGATVEHDGNMYYTSFSAATFIVPYAFFKVFNLSYTIQNLYIFNSILYICSAVLLFLLMLELFKGKLSIPFIALICLFAGNFQLEVFNSLGAVYWAQSLFQVLFLGQLLLFENFEKRYCRVLFYILCLTVPFVEWTGFFGNLGFCIAFIIKNRKIDKTAIFKISIVCVTTIISLVLFILHFLSVLPADIFFSALKERFFARNVTSEMPISKLLGGYWTSFGILLVIIAALLIITFIVKSSRKVFLSLSKRYLPLIFVLIFASFENIIMKEHAYVYTYDRMKVLILLVMVLFMLFISLKSLISKKNITVFACLSCIVFAFVGITNLARYNTSGATIYKTDVDYIPTNNAIAQFIRDRFSGENSVLGQNDAVRGYTNTLFDRGVFEYTTLEQLKETAAIQNKRYAVYLHTSAGFWGVFEYKKVEVFDFQTNTLTEYIVDSEYKFLKEI